MGLTWLPVAHCALVRALNSPCQGSPSSMEMSLPSPSVQSRTSPWPDPKRGTVAASLGIWPPPGCRPSRRWFCWVAAQSKLRNRRSALRKVVVECGGAMFCCALLSGCRVDKLVSALCVADCLRQCSTHEGE
eukprot:7069305-Prymnesium_polylepis.1